MFSSRGNIFSARSTNYLNHSPTSNRINSSRLSLAPIGSPKQYNNSPTRPLHKRFVPPQPKNSKLHSTVLDMTCTTDRPEFNGSSNVFR